MMMMAGAGMLLSVGCSDETDTEGARLVEAWLTAEMQDRDREAGGYWHSGKPLLRDANLHSVSGWTVLAASNNSDMIQSVKVSIQSADPVTGSPIRRNYRIGARRDSPEEPMLLSIGMSY